MEQTLGKRIVQSRRRLGLTQDALAEQLGVTAQAVSKWENDQSCPDIAMLPRLAQIFGITTDELLGVETKQVREAEVVSGEAAEDAPEGEAGEKAYTWEFKLDNTRRGHIGIALWVLLVGGLMLADYFWGLGISFWSVLWPSGMLVFGLFGVLPRPSFFRIGCLIFGLYFLLDALHSLPYLLTQTGILFPGLLLVFGVSLLVDALRKPRHARVRISRSGSSIGSRRSGCTMEAEHFDCSTSFGEDSQVVSLPRLSSGTADVSFGELTLDLRGCGEIADGCAIELNSAFGSLEMLVPKQYRVKQTSSTAFGAVSLKGEPAPEAAATIFADCNASFGEIVVRYV